MFGRHQSRASVSEILAINDHEFLVVDETTGPTCKRQRRPTRKKIYRINLTGRGYFRHWQSSAGALPLA